MLGIEVEFLTGVSVSSPPHSREEAEWPPHPDRLFQALVAAWGRNQSPDAEERAALEWLESLDAARLSVSAPEPGLRDVVRVFVPPNDPRTIGAVGSSPPKDLKPALDVMPATRRKKERFFPATVPLAAPAIVRYVWPDAPGLDLHRPALARLAREVTYLGHSHSLVRVALLGDAPMMPDQRWLARRTELRLPYPDRLEHLQECHTRSSVEGRIVRPRPSLVTKAFVPAGPAAVPSTGFDAGTVTVLADMGGHVPELSAFPLVAKRLRDALLGCMPEGTEAPTLLTGHGADGGPNHGWHMAVLPLADVGWDYSQGRLLGAALVMPAGTDADAADRRTTFGAVASFLSVKRGRVGLLHFGRAGSWSIGLEPEPGKASLRFERYVGPARRWATVLPAVLDRHPKNGRPGEALDEVLVRACLNVGLPPEAVDSVRIETHKHATPKGAPSVHEVVEALASDSPYRGRPLLHLVLEFARPVRGPLVLGAGRFRGLGLCLPLDEGG